MKARFLGGLFATSWLVMGQGIPTKRQPLVFSAHAGRPASAATLSRLCGAPVCESSLVRVDVNRLRAALQERTPVLSLPMPDGSLRSAMMFESAVLSPEMSSRFPEIKTYSGRLLDDATASVALDVTADGFHAMILTGNAVTMIDPAEAGMTLAYRPVGTAGMQQCALDAMSRGSRRPRTKASSLAVDLTMPVPLTSLRVFRTAVVASASYSNAQGGTEALTTAAIAGQMNRVNALFERDASIRMQLVDTVTFLTAESQPFTREQESQSVPMAQAAHDILTKRAGLSFDVGHMFTGDGGGGVALSLGIVCDDAMKGGGSSLGINNVTPLHWINLVAHEFGHQFGAEHTFNASGVAGCKAESRSAGTAFEPGSGTTTMSYVGLCNATDQIQDLQGSEDLVFHAYSIKQMLDYVNTAGGKATTSCGQAPLSADINAIPTITPIGNFTIPARTPFYLEATATDVDDPAKNLTYSWDQVDVGAGNPANDDDAARPLFRSYLPQAASIRYFPSLKYILNNSNLPPELYTAPYGPPGDGGTPAETKTFRTGEVLATTDRTMRFRVSVRDNRTGNGSVAGGIAFADSVISVVGGAGPFRVTAPNGGESFAAGSSVNITWDVAGTTGAPIGALEVQILLSTDGGQRFATALTNAIPNNGSATVTLPSGVSTNTARIAVVAMRNVFFDVSDANFVIQ